MVNTCTIYNWTTVHWTITAQYEQQLLLNKYHTDDKSLTSTLLSVPQAVKFNNENKT